MKVKVIECESFEDFLNAMHSQMNGIISKVAVPDDANSSNSTEETPVYKKEMPVEKKEKKKKLRKVPKRLAAYVRILGQKHNLSFQGMANFLTEVWEVSKTAAYNMLAKQIAITIDKVKYEDHISNSKELFVINLYNGEVFPVKASIKNLELIPVFRTKEDAEFAREILKPLLNEMFGE